jgi:asparagine synthase (glutamine-hydrolysing)
MCGICGVVRLDGGAAELEMVRRMNACIVHRGPDGEGTYARGPVALAMRRLAIIDLAGSDQPIWNEDGTVAIVFNGEIYNYRELARELADRGHRFTTHGDTETIVHAYEEWGDDCVRRLRGIFAFAIHDRRGGGPGRVLIARDHLGVKPLYFGTFGGALVFGSEVRSLLASGLVPRTLDPHGLRSYLAYGSVQEPLTLVEGVQSLLPGHTMAVQDGRMDVRRYWSIPGPEAAREPGGDLLERMRERLEDAVGSQMVADVPVGVFLSGGIDSTAIAALMKRAATGPVRSFSVVFDEAKYDEREYARAAARHIGTEHHEIHLRGEDVRAVLPRAVSSFDQPSMDGLNTWFVSHAVAGAGLRVALSGVGGDELFAGYNELGKPLLAERWGRRLRRVPGPLRPAVAAGLARVGTGHAQRAVDVLRSELHPYFMARQIFSAAQAERLLQPDVAARSGGWEPERFRRLACETAGYDPLNRASALELQTYMLSTLLRDTDQVSMAHSLEVRVPLLDPRLVEAMFAIPGAHKVQQGQPKPLLTLPLDGALPRECVHRPKRGFELPLAVWLRESLREEMEASFHAADVHPFSTEGLRGAWRAFDEGRMGWSRVWALFGLRRWLAEHRVTPA